MPVTSCFDVGPMPARSRMATAARSAPSCGLLFVEAAIARPALQTVVDLGVALDVAEALEQCRERGDARGWLAGVRVDIFVNSIPLHDSAQLRRARVSLAGTPLWVLAAEDLVVLKMLFHRPKDLEDCRRVLALQGARFDAEYAQQQLRDHLGHGDSRINEFDEMLSDCRAE